MADNKKPRLKTPIGEAKWAHLFVPKPPFKGEADKGAKFMIDVVFSPDDPAWKAWAGDLKQRINALPVQYEKVPMPDGTKIPKKKQMPIKPELDVDDKPTGRYYVTFKTGERFKPGVFDKYGQEVPESVSIGNGSKVRVAYVESEYAEFGGGIALYLNAVQVVELLEYKPHNAAAYGFEVEPVPAGAAAGGTLPPQAEDDLPF